MEFLLSESFEEVIAAPHELIVDEDHWYGVPIVLVGDFFPLSISLLSFGINPCIGNLVFIQIVLNLDTEWAPIST